jgi:pimeloyl-ACP methyl ester carboxylesterase
MRDQVVRLRDGTDLSYLDVGPPDGDVVMYFHGTPGSRMQATGPLLAEAERLGVRVVAPDRPGYGGSSFVRYRVVDYPVVVARFADALGIGTFGVIGTSGGGRYACACGAALGDRVRRVAMVAATAPVGLPGVRGTWSAQDRRLYAMATRTPWLLRILLAKTARDLRRDPDRMLQLLRRLSAADEAAVARADVQAIIRAMSAEAFRQGGRGTAHDLRLEARPWGVSLDAITAPVDIWHGRDDTIVRCEQAEIMADAVPSARRHFLPGHGHFSLVMTAAADYLEPFTSGA